MMCYRGKSLLSWINQDKEECRETAALIYLGVGMNFLALNLCRGDSLTHIKICQKLPVNIAPASLKQDGPNDGKVSRSLPYD